MQFRGAHISAKSESFNSLSSKKMAHYKSINVVYYRHIFSKLVGIRQGKTYLLQLVYTLSKGKKLKHKKQDQQIELFTLAMKHQHAVGWGSSLYENIYLHLATFIMERYSIVYWDFSKLFGCITYFTHGHCTRSADAIAKKKGSNNLQNRKSNWAIIMQRILSAVSKNTLYFTRIAKILLSGANVQGRNQRGAKQAAAPGAKMENYIKK